MKKLLLTALLGILIVIIGCGESDDSNPTGPNITVPTPVLTATSTSVHLTWSAISGADSVFVERAQGATGGTFARIASLAGSATSYHDMNVVPGTTYRYQLVAKSGSNTFTGNAASTTTLQQLTWQSDPDNEFDLQYPIAPQSSDPDAGVILEVTANRAGKLFLVEFMHGIDATKVKVNCGVGFHRNNGGLPNPNPVATVMVPAGDIIENGSAGTEWSQADFSSANINIANNEKFFVSIVPLFSDTTATSLQYFAIKGETADPNNNPAINTWIYQKNHQVVLPNLGGTGGDFDAAIAVTIEY